MDILLAHDELHVPMFGEVRLELVQELRLGVRKGGAGHQLQQVPSRPQSPVTEALCLVRKGSF